MNMPLVRVYSHFQGARTIPARRRRAEDKMPLFVSSYWCDMAALKIS